MQNRHDLCGPKKSDKSGADEDLEDQIEMESLSGIDLGIRMDMD